MANFFRTIQQKAGSNGPEWLSDHPDPGDRYETIVKESQSLRVEHAYTPDPRAFDQLQTHLKRLPPAPSSAEAARETARTGGNVPPPSGNVEPPSGRSTQYSANLFRISVPSNWRALRGTESVTFAPPGAYGALNGRSVFTHGLELGVARNQGNDLRAATDEFVDALLQGNSDLRRSADPAEMTFGGRRGLRTTFSNESEATGKPETIELFTVLLRDRRVFYLIAVAPADAFADYSATFDRAVASIRLND